LDRVVQAEERAQRHWKERNREATAGKIPDQSPPLTIALEREAGVLGTMIAHEVGARLGWPVYDHELLERIAEKLDLRVGLLESMDERRQSWLKESMEALSMAPTFGENAFVRHLVQTILSLSTHGHCVIVGRGAPQILPAQTTLRVGLVGPLEDRIDTWMRRFAISHEEAARRVKETDHERRRFIQDHFRKNPANPDQYDLILNTSRWTVAECVTFIIDAHDRMREHISAGARQTAPS
jgi:cytidylate kinase